MESYFYGYGDKGKQYLENDGFVEWLSNKYGVCINGIIDKDEAKTGREVEVLSTTLKISRRVNDVNAIVFISLDKYERVYDDFLSRGYHKENLILLSDEIRKYTEELIGIGLYENKSGVEIGGPSKLYSQIYKTCKACDCVNFSADNTWVKYNDNRYIVDGKNIGEIIISDATNLEVIANEKYDFLISSNNLEHIANPMKALSEFTRCIKRNGYISVVVPKKEMTFDHRREDTTFEHIIEDWKNNVGEDDMTHLSEIISKHDYDMDPGCGGKENFIHRAKINYENRCLHHHVFSLIVLEKMFSEVNLRTIRKGYYADNYYIIGQKK